MKAVSLASSDYVTLICLINKTWTLNHKFSHDSQTLTMLRKYVILRLMFQNSYVASEVAVWHLFEGQDWRNSPALLTRIVWNERNPIELPVSTPQHTVHLNRRLICHESCIDTWTGLIKGRMFLNTLGIFLCLDFSMEVLRGPSSPPSLWHLLLSSHVPIWCFLGETVSPMNAGLCSWTCCDSQLLSKL